MLTVSAPLDRLNSLCLKLDSTLETLPLWADRKKNLLKQIKAERLIQIYLLRGNAALVAQIESLTLKS